MEKLRCNSDPSFNATFDQEHVAWKRHQRMEEFFPPDIDTYDKRLEHIRMQIKYLEKQRPTSNKIFWITINYDDKVTSLDDLKRLTDKVANRSFITKYWYSIEQRGTIDQDLGTGRHIHMLCYSKNPTAQIQRDIYNTVKNNVGNKQHVQVQSFPESMLQDKLDYLHGEKWDDEKGNKVEADRLFRKNNMLSSIYTNATQETNGSTQT